MNRNVMYDYLKDIGMKPFFVYHKKGHYHTKFTLDEDEPNSYCIIVTDWGYIRGCNTINLCTDEVVIESECYYLGTAKINIRYDKMEKFEVRIMCEE